MNGPDTVMSISEWRWWKSLPKEEGNSLSIDQNLRKRALRAAAAVAVAGVAALSLVPAQAAFATGGVTDGNYCNPYTAYVSISDQGSEMQGVGPSQANYNGTGSDATSTFTAQASGTVSLTASSSVSVDGSILVAGVNGTLGISTSVSMTASLGNSTTVTAHPGYTAHATYGVWRKRTYGNYEHGYSNCTYSDAGTTAWSPWWVGWNTWTS